MGGVGREGVWAGGWTKPHPPFNGTRLTAKPCAPFNGMRLTALPGRQPLTRPTRLRRARPVVRHVPDASPNECLSGWMFANTGVTCPGRQGRRRSPLRQHCLGLAWPSPRPSWPSQAPGQQSSGPATSPRPPQAPPRQPCLGWATPRPPQVSQRQQCLGRCLGLATTPRPPQVSPRQQCLGPAVVPRLSQVLEGAPQVSPRQQGPEAVVPQAAPQQGGETVPQQGGEAAPQQAGEASVPHGVQPVLCWSPSNHRAFHSSCFCRSCPVSRSGSSWGPAAARQAPPCFMVLRGPQRTIA